MSRGGYEVIRVGEHGVTGGTVEKLTEVAGLFLGSYNLLCIADQLRNHLSGYDLLG
jgi:hypothetical protein